MKPSKPLFMKTYGKRGRKLSAWISPQNHKQAFDSTPSTDGDISVFEPSKPARRREKRPSVARPTVSCFTSPLSPQPAQQRTTTRQKITSRPSARAVRAAKRKAMVRLTETSSDEENIVRPSLLCPQPPRQSKTTREKITSRPGARAVRAAKRTTMTYLTETSSDEENIIRPSPLCPQPPRQSKTTSQSRRVSGVLLRQKGRRLTRTSESSEDSRSTTKRQNSVQIKTDSNVCLPPVDRFVTIHRRAGGTKPKLPEALFSILNSSNEFTCGASGSNRIVKPSKRVPPSFLLSSVENSLNAAGTTSFSTNPFEEIFLNESADHSFRLFPSKAIFCSTPSAGPLRKRPRLKPLSSNALSSSPPSMAGGCTGILSTFQEDLHSSGQLARAPPTGLQCEPQSSLVEQERIEWLVKVLKEKCLNVRCTVQLERLYNLTVSQLDSQTTYSSCLGQLSSVHSQQTREHPSVDGSRTIDLSQSLEPSCQLYFSVTDNGSSGYLQSANSLESPKCAASVTGCQSTNNSPSANSEHSAGHSYTQLLTNSPKQALFTEEQAAAVKDKCLTNDPEMQEKAALLNEKRDLIYCKEDSAMKNRDSAVFGHKIVSDKVVVKHSKEKRRKEEKKRRSTSTDRPGTNRKACVSGLSVSRWKNKDSSISELMSTRHRQPRELLSTTRNFSTPVRAIRHNLSSLLADLTPNTHTWSRLKAALSVHRKGMVLLSPKSSHLSVLGTPGRADVSQSLFTTPFRTLLAKRLQPQQLSCSSLELFEDADLSDAEKVYAECNQERPLPWEQCILPQRMKRCAKIGEGTFGEVFSTTNASGDTVALKIIPVEGSEVVNGEDQKTFGEILHEIIISKELSSLKEKQQNKTHGFIGLNDIHCVQGCYPPDFLNAWDTFDKEKGSENDRPDFFEKDQIFIILEFEFGGSDLENSNGTLMSLGVAKSILHQITAALAVAEQELNFEHRDLHWGNVLVKTTKEKKATFLLNGETHSLETKGVLVRIIDYSLSRLEIDDLIVSCDISKDEELFMGQGDYQFDIYRLMRQENGNNWNNYHPHTNVLWLHYLCSKLLSMKYRGSGGRGAKGIRTELTCFYDNVLQYSSATEALKNCPMFQ